MLIFIFVIPALYSAAVGEQVKFWQVCILIFQIVPEGKPGRTIQLQMDEAGIDQQSPERLIFILYSRIQAGCIF